LDIVRVKMSKAADQTIIKLTVIFYTLKVFDAENRFARADIKKAIRLGMLSAEIASRLWPAMCNRYWQEKKWQVWKDYVLEFPDRDFGTSAGFAKMCCRLCADLEEAHGHNAEKMAMLQPIFDVARLVDEFCDPDGLNYPAFDMSTTMLRRLDEIIEVKETA